MEIQHIYWLCGIRDTYFKFSLRGSSVSKMTATGIDVGSFQYAVSRSSRVSNIMKLIGWSPGSRCIVNHSWLTLSRKCCEENTIISHKQFCISTYSRIKWIHTYIISLSQGWINLWSQVTMVLRNWVMEHNNLHGKYF